MLDRLVRNRIIRFEVATLTKDRWVIECLRDSEADAVAVAKGLLESDKYEAVRVTRERSMLDGFTTQTPVFEERRGARNKAPLKLSEPDDDDAWCAQLEDLYGGRSRRAISQLLRSFLDRNGITAMELLHDIRAVKRLDAADGLRTAALHRVVRARSEATGTPMTECRRVLDGILNEATNRARDAIASRALPRLNESELDALIDACRQATPDRSMQAFYARYGICRALENRQGLGDRLVLLMKMAETARRPESLQLIDGFSADCLASSQVVQEMLGRQTNFGTAMVALAAMAAKGDPGTLRDSAPWAPRFILCNLENDFHESRSVLLARVRRAMASEQPFTRGDVTSESEILNAIAEKLRDGNGGLLGGSAMVKAIAKRHARLDLPGGLNEISVPAGGDRLQKIKHLLLAERSSYSELKKRAIATLMLDLANHSAGEERAGFASLGSALASSDLLPPAKEAIGKAMGLAS